jgi:hypothetical protein
MAEHEPSTLAWLRDTDRRFSVARAQLVIGGVFMLLALELWALELWALENVLRRAAPSIPEAGLLPQFIAGATIVVAAAAALPLEARLVRLPARLRAWMVFRSQVDTLLRRDMEKPESDESQRRRRWSLAGERGRPDIAVLQLVIGAVIAPFLSGLATFTSVAWRLVAITALSEIVYLAFLGARLIKMGELTDLGREIQTLRVRRKQLVTPTEPSTEGKMQIANLELVEGGLSDRAGVLWRQLGALLD